MKAASKVLMVTAILVVLVVLLMGESIARWFTPLFSRPVESIEMLTYIKDYQNVRFMLSKEEIGASGIRDILEKYKRNVWDKFATEESFPHDPAYSFVITYADGQTDRFDYTESPNWIFRYIRPSDGEDYFIVLKDENRELLSCLESFLNVP